jgi:hypothetical protein
MNLKKCPYPLANMAPTSCLDLHVEKGTHRQKMG